MVTRAKFLEMKIVFKVREKWDLLLEKWAGIDLWAKSSQGTKGVNCNCKI